MKRLAKRPKQSHIDALKRSLNKPAYERIKLGLGELYGYHYVSLCEAYVKSHLGTRS